MSQQTIRPYIVALYTLKDEFISILKAKGAEGIGDIFEPKMTLKNDGTQEFKFSIPMYIRDNKTGELKENPSWFNYEDGNLITGMRKVKVIFGEPKDNEINDISGVTGVLKAGEDDSLKRCLSEYNPETRLHEYNKYEKPNLNELYLYNITVEDGTLIRTQKQLLLSDKNGIDDSLPDDMTQEELDTYYNAYHTLHHVSREEVEKNFSALGLFAGKNVNKFSVFEFIITKVTESHSEGMLTCEVETEGLAFHELGRTGYKINFSKESYELDYSAYFDGIISKMMPIKEHYGFEIPDNSINSSMNLTFRERSVNGENINYEQINDEAYLKLRLEDLVKVEEKYDFSFSYDNFSNSSPMEWGLYYYDGRNSEIEIASKLKMGKENKIEGITFESNNVSYIKLTVKQNGQDISRNIPVLSSFVLKQEKEVKANINYWADKVVEGTGWNYVVENDWSTLDGVDNSYYFELDEEARARINEERESKELRRMDIVYEDEYVSSWKTEMDEATNEIARIIPATYESAKEKERIVESSESNRYNILVDIAEKFEEAVRFEYEYDRFFRIIGRKIIFYNSIVKARDIIDITYPYDTSEVSREMDCSDIVTKMFVKNIDDDTTLTGQISISDSEANLSKEEYILDFDYLYDIGTISKEQYDEVSNFEKKVRLINIDLNTYQNIISQYERELAEISGKLMASKNKINSIAQGIEECEQNIDATIGVKGATSVTIAPQNALDYFVYSDENGLPYISIDRNGITNLKIYSRLNSSPDIDYFPEKTLVDKYRTRFFLKSTPNDSKYVYCSYTYDPLLYYNDILSDYVVARAKAVAERNTYQEKNDLYENIIDENNLKLKLKLQEKNELLQKFEKIMGPALREGSWQDDEYKDMGNKYEANLSLSYSSLPDEIEYVYDDEPFEDEQKPYFEFGATQKQIFYPYIEVDINAIKDVDPDNLFLTYNKYWEKISNPGVSTVQKYNPLNRYTVGSLCTKEDLKGNTEYYRCLIANSREDAKDPSLFSGSDYYGIDSKLIPAIMESGGARKFIFLLTDETLFNGTTRKWMVDNIKGAKLSKFTSILQTTKNGTEYKMSSEDIVDNISIKVPEEGSSIKLVYPRIKIYNMNVKINYDEAPEIFANKLLSNQLTDFEDYTSLPKYANSEDDKDCYTLTIKPITFLKRKISFGSETWLVKYSISNASTSIYLDAKKVAKENAYPQVTYNVKVNAINKEIISKLHDRMNQICHINDYDLKFKNVCGYISEMNLDLDNPWEDDITVNNYKTKFEDLFSSIVATTEEMKTNGAAIERAAESFLTNGTIEAGIIEKTIRDNLLTYDFDAGKLTISEENGIWAIADNDAGVVAFRGGGISIANTKDEDGNWIWHSGITPNGINASLLNAGRVNLDKVFIYAGTNYAYQMNSTGLYAYRKLKGNDEDPEYSYNEYVVHNGEGLFLINEPGTKYTINGQEKILEKKVERVSVSWDGFTIKDYEGKKVFYADTDGNLTLKGKIYAESGEFTGSIKSGSTITGATIIVKAKDSDDILFKADPTGVSVKGAIEATSGKFSGTITSSSTISGASITGASISGGTISGGAISGGTISGGAISGGSITGTDITVGGQNTYGSLTVLNENNQTVFSASRSGATFSGTLSSNNTTSSGYSAILRNTANLYNYPSVFISTNHPKGSNYVSIAADGIYMSLKDTSGSLLSYIYMKEDDIDIWNPTSIRIRSNNGIRLIGPTYQFSRQAFFYLDNNPDDGNNFDIWGESVRVFFYTSSFNLVGRSGIDNGANLHVSGSVEVAGKVVHGSDEKLKKIYENKDFSNILYDLKPIQYSWIKDKENKMHFGLGARHTKSVLEKYNIKNQDVVSKLNEDSEYYGISYQDMHCFEIAAIQEQKKKIDELEKKIKELEELINK